MSATPDQPLSSKFSFRSSQRLLDTKKKQTYLEIILTFVTIIFFGLFALRPTFSTIATLLGDINNLENVKTQLQEKIDAMFAAQQILDENGSKLGLLEEAIPISADLAMFTAQVDRAVEGTEFSLNSVGYGDYAIDGGENSVSAAETTADAAPQGNWTAVKFIINGSGRYESILEFTRRLVSFRRVIIIESISIDYSDIQIETDVPRVVISGAILHQPKNL